MLMRFVEETNLGTTRWSSCPGTPISFAEYMLTTRTQATLWIKNLQLPQLTAGQLTVMSHE